MIHVFVGPTLPRSEPLLTAPGIRVWPPVRYGDLLCPEIVPADTVVIIDGLYHQAPALRHKEILSAIGAGIRVIGAASIGALRAAELEPFGMLGVGSIYAAYARGEIDGDDEVVVGQAPDGAWESLTWPVVNLRYVLELAHPAGVLSRERAGGLLEALRAVYYPQRTSTAMRAVCRRRGETEFADWLTEQCEQDAHFGDVKRTDALLALRTALSGQAPRIGAARPPVPHTTHTRRWSNAAARQHVDGLELSTEDRLIYQQVFDPRFARTWAAYLDHCSLQPTDTGPGLPLAERLALVTGGDLPADQVFHPAVDLRNPATVGLLLAGETRADQQAVARYADALAHERRTRPGFSTDAIRDDLTRRILLRAWACGEEHVDAEASARGLTSAARAIAAAKRLVPGFLRENSERKDNARAC